MPDPNYPFVSDRQPLPSIMLPKDVKDILEVVYCFLTDDLKDETLSMKVECTRGGIVLQLDKLRQLYPTLDFSSKSTPLSMAPPPYTEHNANGIVHNASSRLSSCSGSTSNYSTSYSNSSSCTGYSEDVNGTGSFPEAREEEEEDTVSQSDEEIYEDFDGVATDKDSPDSATKGKEKSKTKLTRSDSRSSQTKLEENYLDDVDPVSFSVLIAKCDYHGTVTKRSKSFLRNSRFQAVLSNQLLYLYQKESDDQQKKVIDLCGYNVRGSSITDSRNSKKKKEVAFELFGQGKKTHTFHCSSERESSKWIEALNSALLNVRKELPIHKNGATVVPSWITSRVPPLPPPLLTLTTVDEDSHTTSLLDDDSEVYEELNSESDPMELEQTLPHNSSSEYLIPHDENGPPVPTIPLPPIPETRQTRSPPERPPLPEILQQARPLPETPEESYDRQEEDFYDEIDEDSFESFDHSGNENLINESINNTLASKRSFSEEILDTIKEKVPNLLDREDLILKSSKLHDRSDINNCPEEDDLNYDIPLENSPVLQPHIKLSKPSVYSPPPVPVKGTPVTPEDDDEEYKVPSSIIPQSIYQVPSSFPVRGAEDNVAPTSSKEASKPVFLSPSQKVERKSKIEPLPQSSVKDIVALLNKNEIEKNARISQNSKPYAKIKNSRNSFLKQQLDMNQEASVSSKEASKPAPELVLHSEDVEGKIKLTRTRTELENGSDVYIAKFDYVAESKEMLSFNRGDEVMVTEASKNSLWTGIIKGKKGYVLKDYIRKKYT